MAEAIRFYLDEHVPHAVAKGLRHRGADAITTQEAGLLGAEDPQQLSFAYQSGRVFVTHDADFLRLAAHRHVHAGIVYAPRRTSIGAIVASLMLIHDVLDAQDMSGRVEFL